MAAVHAYQRRHAVTSSRSSRATARTKDVSGREVVQGRDMDAARRRRPCPQRTRAFARPSRAENKAFVEGCVGYGAAGGRQSGRTQGSGRWWNGDSEKRDGRE